MEPTTIAALIVAALAMAAAVAQALGKRKWASVANALIAGVEAAGQAMQPDAAKTIKATIKDQAVKAGIDAVLHRAVKRLTD